MTKEIIMRNISGKGMRILESMENINYGTRYMTNIIKHANISRSQAYRIIDLMIEKEMIIDERIGARYHLKMTPKGRKIYNILKKLKEMI